MTQPEADAARAKAEAAIEKILIGLENDTGRRLDFVTVDTRNFARCDVEIWFVGEVGK
jgi:hypothetical protein